jgi:hypothetical protein
MLNRVMVALFVIAIVVMTLLPHPSGVSWA